MNQIKFIKISIYVLLILVSFLLPLVSFDGYSILEHTTSHLGAQNSNNAWIMNIVFILLGAISFIILMMSKICYHQVFGALFGLSLILTGIFKHAPVIEVETYDLIQDQLHSIFATTTGISFVVLAVGHGFMSEKMQRVVGISIGALATLLSIGMMQFPEYMGLLQRIMFLSSFYWLFFYMKFPSDKVVTD